MFLCALLSQALKVQSVLEKWGFFLGPALKFPLLLMTKYIPYNHEDASHSTAKNTETMYTTLLLLSY